MEVVNTEIQKIKGGIIILGSLFWENSKNCLPGDAKGERREKWRKDNLLITEESVIIIPAPVRYGRCSSSRLCTYTMVLSKDYSHPDKLGSAIIVPFKDENAHDFTKYDNFVRQAKLLADVEGISDGGKVFAKSWGAVAIWQNAESKHRNLIDSFWKKITRQYGYGKNTNHFQWSDGKLIDDSFKLDLEIHCDFDFLFCTYILPKHKNLYKNEKQMYPEAAEIAGSIISSGYETYFRLNNKSGIVTIDDSKIDSLLANTTGIHS